MKYTFLGLAILLAILWVVARLVLALSGVFLHVLWIAALVFFVIWLFGVISGRSRV
ncbi:MAG: hypothetical protein SFU53_12640 [Terrimicrobiaceae bacterium]|nr:hypothetical protein [Terrimicrobiaceae bacterium]